MYANFFFFFAAVLRFSCFFFFQAEDGIRDADVTGVQTCALPISGMLQVDAFLAVHRDPFGSVPDRPGLLQSQVHRAPGSPPAPRTCSSRSCRSVRRSWKRRSAGWSGSRRDSTRAMRGAESARAAVT